MFTEGTKMEIEDYPLEKRIFHLDEECYVIYLGSHPDDYKPFLRIGNSKYLTKNVIDHIYNVVITESCTGNPILEPENVDLEDLENIRYVGDKNTISRFLDFLKQFHIETKNIAFDQEIPAHDHNAVLYIYDNGNITLLYDKNRIFDLREREKKDLHFVERARWIKDQLVKNPLRYTGQNFEGTGFFLIKDSYFLFHRERCIAFGLPDHYFQSLAGFGIDPDLISAVAVDRASGDLLQLAKRKKFLKENLSVLTNNSEPLQNALRLFSTGKPDSLKFSLSTSSETTGKMLHGFTVKRMGPSYIATHRDIPIPMVLGTRTPSLQERCLILGMKNRISIGPLKKEISMPIAEGIPYTILVDPPDESKIGEEYIASLLSAFQDFFTPEESSLLRIIQEFISGDTPLAESAAQLRKGVKAVRIVKESPLPYVLCSLHALCALYEKKRQDGDTSGTLTALRKVIEKRLTSLSPDVPHFPLIGKCYITPEGFFILYQPSKKTLKSDDFALAKDFANGVKGITSSKAVFYTDELARLNQLIKGLSAAALVRRKKTQEKTEIGAPPGRREGITAPEGAAPPVEKPAAPTKKMPVLTRILLLIAGIIVIASVILFVPPISLYRKSISGRAERQMIVQGPEGEAQIQKEQREEVTSITEQPSGEETMEEATSQESETTAEGQEMTLDKEELESFLSLGYIQITILDVYKLTNKIALSNGYRGLDSPEELGRDPDWIYPENVFLLPDGTRYTVVKGDTIWYIAKRFIKKNLDRDWEKYQELRKELEMPDLNEERKNQILDELKALKEGSYSENFVKEIDKTLNRT